MEPPFNCNCNWSIYNALPTKKTGSAEQSNFHMFSEAPIKWNSFKTTFETCSRRLVEFDVSR